ncbi:MAG: 50S ribosomal protein L4 [Epsilonproteobacteria bacterium]|nr:50S ribosomal protein L4 [Campylobacterota bacterium]
MGAKVVKLDELPKDFMDINPHNLYLYCKAYLASQRANSAHTKNRSAVSGGGKKPFSQKGGGRARQGSIRAPQFRGGGVVFGPSNGKNYNQKVNKKQKRLALKYAISEHAKNGTLFVLDSIVVESGKTRDAKRFVDSLNQRNILIVKSSIDEKSYLAFRNIPNVCLIELNELNAYLTAKYHSLVVEKAVLDKLTKES